MSADPPFTFYPNGTKQHQNADGSLTVVPIVDILPGDIAALPGPTGAQGPVGTVTNNSLWTTLEQYGATAYPTRAAAEAGTDSTTAIKAFLTAWGAGNGTTLRLGGWYRCTEALLLPNGNTLTAIGTQPPLRLTGSAGSQPRNGTRVNDGAGIVWTAEGGTAGAVAKIDTRGLGLLIFENCSLASAAGSGNVLPFVHTTFTTIQTGIGFMLQGAVHGASAAEDGFILGGTFGHESDSSHDRRLSDCGFQGYGTVIQCVGCNGIKRLAALQMYANAIRILNNNIWNTCGNNSTTGSAIEINGTPGGGTTNYAVGTLITGNLIEGGSYKRGIYARMASSTFIAGNDLYDATSLTTETVYLDSTCLNSRVVCSQAPSGGKPYLTDNSGASVFGQENGAGYDVAVRLKTLSNSTFPSTFGYTEFTDGSGTAFQPGGSAGTAANNTAIKVLRAGAAASSPGATAWQIDQNGAQTFSDSNSAQSGNVIVSAAGQAEYWAQGKSWGFNGRTGSNMLIDTGTGGSVLSIKAANVQHKTQAGVLVLKFSNTAGSGGGEGIDFGSASDVSLFRLSSTVLKTPQKFVTTAGLGVGNSAAATTLGAVVKKMEVFSATGASLGFVPIYDAIT